MKPVRSSLLAVAALACALAFVPALFADSQARIVRLSFIDGTVQIDRDTGDLEKAIINMPVVQGTKIFTREGARAEVEFEDGSTVRLGPDSQIDFTELSLRDDGGKVSAMAVMQGTAYFDITPRNKDEFRVAFASDEVTVEKAVRFRVSLTDETAKLAVFKGELNVKGATEATVKKNQTLDLDRMNGESEVAKGVAEEPLDEWVKSREEYRDRYATAQYGAPYNGYYGLSDLNYYGNYYYQPGWGWVWRPYNVGFGWDPFSDGAWCWYPGYGYTWVSWQPWGWIPYRYGRWAYIPGWGWGWVPGGFRGGWLTSPVVVNAPPAYRAPQPPTAPRIIPRVPTRPVVPPPTILVRGHEPRVVGGGDRDMPLPRTVGGEPGRPIVRTQVGQDTPQGPMRGPSGTPRADQPSLPGPRGDRGSPMPRPDRGSGPAPAPRVDHPSGPSPRVDHPSAPSPRVDHPSAPSGPSPHMGPSAPTSPGPSAPHSPPPSAPSHSGGDARGGGGRPPGH